jgi:hypothetical protein
MIKYVLTLEREVPHFNFRMEKFTKNGLPVKEDDISFEVTRCIHKLLHALTVNDAEGKL